MNGKRIAGEGGEMINKKKWLLWGGVGIAILFALYLGLCAWVMQSPTIFPCVSVGDISVGGMTQTEVNNWIEKRWSDTVNAIPVEWQDENGTALLSGGFDAMGLNRNYGYDGWMVGRTQFITAGFHYLAHMMGCATNIPAEVVMTSEGRENLTTLLEGISDSMADTAASAGYTKTETSLILLAGVSGTAIDVETAVIAGEKTMADYLNGYVFGNEIASPESLMIPVTTYRVSPEPLNLAEIHSSMVHPAEDAYVGEASNEVVPHVTGVDFDLNTATALYNDLEEGTTATLPLIFTEPEVTTETLKNALYRDVLATKTTKVSGTTDRKLNVHLAADYVNDTILLPGEVFSYNDAIRYCTIDAGFYIGDGYVGGKTVPVVGGGVCQVSSTLYAALLTTSLKIVERSAHMYSVGYVPDGMDATYYTDVLDFKFENNTEYPIKIVTKYSSSNQLTVTVLGTKTDDNRYVPHSTVTNYVTNAPRYRADASIPQGSIVKKQTAYTGRTATVTRDIYDGDGNYVETEKLHTDVFKSRPAIFHYNPLDAEALGIPAGYVNSDTAVEVPVTVPTTVPVLPTPEPEPEPTVPEVSEPVVPEAEQPEVDAGIEES